jgi:hypothetical protein
MTGMRYRLLLVAAALLALLPVSALAQDKILELDTLPGREAIPPDCSGWHELWPSFCAISHQDSLLDNGDGELSACDQIILDGSRYRVDWVGPTYWMDCELILEPTDYQPGSPVCQVWVEIWPDYGQQWHIDGWQDNGNGVVDACDILVVSGQGTVLTCHLNEVALNIRVTGEPTPTEESTWGRIKSLFGF